MPGNVRKGIPLFESDDCKPADDVITSGKGKLVSLDFLFIMARIRVRVFLSPILSPTDTCASAEDAYPQRRKSEPMRNW